MNDKKEIESDSKLVLPGDKIAVIEEFVPDETCYEKDGGIYSRVIGHIFTDRKKHKISVIPEKPHRSIENGAVGVGRVEFIKKQVANVNIFHLNQEEITIPISAVLHISEVSRRFVRNMYEVARPGDWVRFRIIRANKPVYISFIGEGLGVVISYCIQCGHELNFKKRNLLECPYCDLIQARITSKYFGKPLSYKSRSSRNETR
ncbi:MAG: exosome complex RNA-binding protein Csl4 [Candidatus Hodarchaeota archaeon]